MSAWVVEVPAPEAPRSVLPAGGSPADDAAYLDWRAGVIAAFLDRDLAARWHNAADRPPAVTAWGFDEALYRALGGPLPLFGTDRLNYQHRLRWLGVALKNHRRDAVLAARQYLDEAARDGV